VVQHVQSLVQNVEGAVQVAHMHQRFACHKQLLALFTLENSALRHGEDIENVFICQGVRGGEIEFARTNLQARSLTYGAQQWQGADASKTLRALVGNRKFEAFAYFLLHGCP